MSDLPRLEMMDGGLAVLTQHQCTCSHSLYGNHAWIEMHQPVHVSFQHAKKRGATSTHMADAGAMHDSAAMSIYGVVPGQCCAVPEVGMIATVPSLFSTMGQLFQYVIDRQPACCA